MHNTKFILSENAFLSKNPREIKQFCKNMYPTVHGSIIYKGQNVETIQISPTNE